MTTEKTGKDYSARTQAPVAPEKLPLSLVQAITRRPSGDIMTDAFRAFVFPNNIREERRRHGYPKLLGLSAELPDIPYIRLSKLERGEVFARADELRAIAAVLGISAGALLVEVNAPDFDIGVWAEPFLDGRTADPEEERFAVMIGAALRARRNGDRSLTIARIDKEFGIAPVILSRIERAQKTLGRWNDATVASIARLFGATDEQTLRDLVTRQYASGELEGYLQAVAAPELRQAHTREKLAALVAELREPTPPQAPGLPALRPSDELSPPRPVAGRDRHLRVYGAPLLNGLIADVPTDDLVEAPAAAGPRSFGLRVCRPTLGGGLPGQATVIVDPDRYPSAGGLAAVREREGYRLVAVTVDRDGAMTGYSVAPDIEIAIGTLPPPDVAAIIAAIFM